MELNHVMQDFRTRYEKTYIWVAPPDSNEESLFYVDQITDDRIKLGAMHLSSPEFGKIVLNMGTAHTLKFKYPPVGVFQSGHDAHIFRRRPLKQYKRGLCAGNSLFYPVHHPLFRAGRPDREEALPYQVVSDAFATNVSYYKDALQMLKSGKFRSVALKGNFSLMLSTSGTKEYTLFYWETPVATVNKDTGDVVFVYETAFTKIIEQVRSR